MMQCVLVLIFVIVGYNIHELDTGRPAPPDEPARDKTPITRGMQMDSDGDEPGKSGRVVKDGASASNTDVVCQIL